MASNTENETLDMKKLQRQTGSEIMGQRTLQEKPRSWYYHRLPRELRVEIFKGVTDPAEQLKLQKTFPDLGDLMKWDSLEVLYFKLIYPLVQGYLWEDWHDIWRLCQVSPEFMDVVLHHFDNSLSDVRNVMSRHMPIKYDFVKGRPEKVMADIRALVDECDTLGRTEWMTNMPYLMVFHLYGSLDKPSSLEFLARFLEAHGQYVWAADIIIQMSGGDGLLDEFLNIILKQIPNAVHFQFYFDNDNYHNAFLHAPDSLPYLPRLRSLCCEYLVSEPFLQKYAAQLTSLAVQGFSPVFQNVSFPNLRYYGSRNVSSKLPNSVRKSPLQVVYLYVRNDDVEGTIPQLPTALCGLHHIGDTLQNLTLEFGRYSMRNWIVSGEHWKRRVQLPNLRILQLLYYKGKLDWLVALPSVQTLVLQDYNRRPKADVGQSSADLIYVSTHRINRFQSNAWTKCPNLRRLIILNEYAKNSSFRVTREEHEAYQNGSRFQKMAITMLAVFQEIWAIFEERGITKTDLCLFFALLYVFIVLQRTI